MATCPCCGSAITKDDGALALFRRLLIRRPTRRDIRGLGPSVAALPPPPLAPSLSKLRALFSHVNDHLFFLGAHCRVFLVDDAAREHHASTSRVLCIVRVTPHLHLLVLNTES